MFKTLKIFAAFLVVIVFTGLNFGKETLAEAGISLILAPHIAFPCEHL
jgi:hypothetical protein